MEEKEKDPFTAASQPEKINQKIPAVAAETK